MSVDLLKLNRKAVTQTYLVANTPAYLYKHLRAEPSVKELGDRLSPRELFEQVVKIDAQSERSEVDVATAYAALVAATHGEPKEVIGAWRSVKIKNLSWANDILSIWFDSFQPESSASFKVKPKLISPSQVSDATNVTSDIEVTLND